MIRPMTCVTFVLALGSGLYLYQAKHDVQMLDRQIEKAVRETEQVREQTRGLHAEWTLLNDPERLRQFADQYLALKPVAPNQFTSLTDLDGRLPAVRMPDPDPPPIPIAATPDAAAPAPVVVEEEEVLPLPPVPPSPVRAPAAIAVAQPPMVITPPSQPVLPPPAPKLVERKPPIPLARPMNPQAGNPPLQAETRPTVTPDYRPPVVRVAEPRPPEPRPVETPRPYDQRPVEQRPLVAAAQPRPWAPAPGPSQAPYAPAPQPQAAPFGGSMLGMARGAAPVAVPRPTPISATPSWQYSN